MDQDNETLEDFFCLMSVVHDLAADVIDDINYVYVHGNIDAEEKILDRAAEVVLGGSQRILVLNGLSAKDCIEQKVNYAGFDIWQRKLFERGVSVEQILTCSPAGHTYAEAESFGQFLKEKKSTKAAFVALPYHLLRCGLTHTQAGKNIGHRYQVYPFQVKGLEWTGICTKQLLGAEKIQVSRLEMLRMEWKRIQKYQAKGDCAEFMELFFQLTL